MRNPRDFYFNFKENNVTINCIDNSHVVFLRIDLNCSTNYQGEYSHVYEDDYFKLKKDTFPKYFKEWNNEFDEMDSIFVDINKFNEIMCEVKLDEDDHENLLCISWNGHQYFYIKSYVRLIYDLIPHDRTYVELIVMNDGVLYLKYHYADSVIYGKIAPYHNEDRYFYDEINLTYINRVLKGDVE